MEDVKKCTPSESQRIKFSVKAGDENPEFVGHIDEKIQDAMKDIENVMPKFSFNDHILFAEVKGHLGKVAILPSLQCGWLKDGSCVEIEKSMKKAGTLTKNLKDSSGKMDEETLFFIKTDGRKNKDLITVIPCTEYKFRNLCVSAIKGDSIEEALEKDGRFVNIEGCKITNEKQKSPGIQITKAQDYHGDIFSVIVKRGSRKRKASGGKPSPGSSETSVNRNNDDQVIIKEEAPGEKSGIPVPYNPPPLDSLSPFQIPLVVVKIAISKAREMLLSPEELLANENQQDKAIYHLVEKKFSKQFDTRRPTRLLEELSSVSKSVGRIFLEQKTGTCFLVKDGIIITNLHVLKDIMAEKKNSTATGNDKEIKVRFNHICPNQTENLHEVFVDEVIAQSNNLELDYALLRLKQSEDLQGLMELGTRIRSNVPDDGLLTILGHPDGQEKVEETCRIVSPYLWRSNMLQKIQSLRPPTPGVDGFLFSCKQKVMSADYDHRIAYDTSLFHGASGSPCINNKGHIIAMHTSGFIVPKELLMVQCAEESVSIIEFGVSFNAIHADLKEHNEDLANSLFPHIEPQSAMESE